MEFWDIYDADKKPTGRTMKRNDWCLKDGEYHLTVLGVVARPDKTFLITKRVMTKAWAPGWWEVSGGAAQAGEESRNAVLREVKEETGLYVRPESICELGEIIELHRDIFEPDKKFICHSLFFYCDVLDEQAPLSLTPSEIAKGYQLKWATPEEVYHRNILIEKDSWIIRDTAFVKMLMDGKICLPG